MVSTDMRRSATLLPAALLTGGVWLLISLLDGPSSGFITGAAAPASKLRGRTAVRGFKEDFEAWRGSLTADEQAMIQSQAENEFDKKYRKKEEWKKDLPEEKIASFGKILGKFFDSESADYKKDLEAKTPDYDGLLKKAATGGMDFSLKQMIVEIDRDADRRYQFATLKIRMQEQEGKKFPQSSPLKEKWAIANNDTESHESALQTLEFLKKAGEDPSCPKAAKAYIDQWVKQGIPPMGENFELLLPQVMVNQVLHLRQVLKSGVEEMKQNQSEAEVDAFVKDEMPNIAADVIKDLVDNYVEARDEVQNEADQMKKFFRSQKAMPGKTKADVLKEIWAEIPKMSGKPVPPLDEEMLAELAAEPATAEGELLHTWGTADKLYKSEAIDGFGEKYLLGVFETKAEAQKAFNDWNAEYEKARAAMRDELQQWSKQEQARLDADVAGQQRIKEVLEDARK